MANIGRNSPCPCGSGEKYKRCCGALSDHQPRGGQPQPDLRTALSYLTGSGRPAEPARGIKLIEEAAYAGDAEAAFVAATIASCSFWRSRNWDKAFDYLMRAARLGHAPAQSGLRILAGGPRGDGIAREDWEAMRGEIDLNEWLAPPPVKTICEAPRIGVIEKFAPAAACDWIIGRARDRLTRATIYDKATGGTTEDGRRTNEQCDLDIESSGALTFVLRARIGAIIQRRDEAMEIPKVLHYAPGETFALHFDYLDPTEPAYATELAQRGQRTDTFLIYLNEDFTGGETHFPEIPLSHVGAKGDAILFTNVDAAGMPDPKTIHAGLPPTSGEKWIFSQWIRELPRG